MHFTREPIIESILSARDGHKLVLKNTKASSGSEISAEVVEIVSFAGSIFYRSQDRSKNFLLPASDFEITEVKDARLVLKNITLDKSNKLQNPPKDIIAREIEEDLASEENISDETSLEQGSSQVLASGQASQSSSRLERRRERRRNRRKRHNEEKAQESKTSSNQDINETEIENVNIDDVEVKEGAAAAVIPTLNLIPPPPTLISQTLARYREKEVTTPSQDEVTLPKEDVDIVVVQEVKEDRSFETPLEPEDLV